MTTNIAERIERLLSIPEAAEVLHVHKSYAWQLVYSGELPTVRIGKRRLVEPDALREFIAARRSDPENDDGPAESTGPSVTTSAGSGGGDAER